MKTHLLVQDPVYQHILVTKPILYGDDEYRFMLLPGNKLKMQLLCEDDSWITTDQNRKELVLYLCDQ